MALSVVLDPSSIALVGASDDPERIGGRPLRFLQRYGFAGAIYPVNPTRATVQGLTAYPDVASLPTVPDVAVIAIPGASALAAVEACAARGVQVAIVMTSGFGEVGPEGAALQQQMVDAARAAGMRLIGPNCYGCANLATGATMTFSTALRGEPPKAGPVAVVSQSGSMSVAPIPLLARLGIGVRGIYGTGNDADVTVAELAIEVARDPGVELLLLYLEAIRDVEPLAELGRLARERDLPVVALKAGRTPGGEAAARSHTGALANEDRLVDALLAQHGIWRARDLDDLVRAAPLHLSRHRRPRGGLVVISNSGASCVQAADAADDAGLPLAALAEGTRTALSEVLPGFATATNPVDLTAGLIGNSGLFSQVLPILGGDPDAGAFLVALPIAGEGYDLPRFAEDARAFIEATGHPLLLAATQDEVAAPFLAAGIPRHLSEADAVAALAQFVAATDRRATALERDPRASSRRAVGEVIVLDEAAGLALAASAGIGVVAHHVCADAEAAVAAASALGGGPVAVKACTSRITHKTDRGLVRLGLRTPEEVRQAAGDLLAELQAVDPASPGVVVAAMAVGLEVLVGGRIDPTFGPLVLVGAGGTDVEAMPDVAVVLAPVGPVEVAEALRRLRMAPRFGGLRGRPPADVEALIDVVVRVGQLLERDDVVSVELNPVFVRPAGDGCVAADAVVELRA